jgi:hypothetical protein
VGVCLYFFASTSLSAGMAPVFKEIIPKTSLSAMMPLYKMCLDSGKVVGPPYSDWASTTRCVLTECARDYARAWAHARVRACVRACLGGWVRWWVRAFVMAAGADDAWSTPKAGM